MGDRVQINWRDACGTVGWTTDPNTESPPDLHSITSWGCVVGYGKDYVTITGDADVANGGIGSLRSIPLKGIVNVKVQERNVLSPEFWFRTHVHSAKHVKE